MIVRSLGLVLVLSSCTSAEEQGTNVKRRASQSTTSGTNQTANSNSNSDDELSIDKPVLVGGSFLTCAAEYQDLNITSPTFGCRLASNGSRVAVPDSASGNIDLFVNGSPVTATTRKAPAGSYWQWIVSTNSKGPFDAKLALKDVIVGTSSSTPVITAGQGAADFEKALVAGSKLAWNNEAQTKVLSIDTDNGDDGLGQMMPTSNYVTTFPRHLVVNKAATSILEIGFYLKDGNTKFCRYIRSASAPSYFVYSTVNNNCGTAPQNNPKQVTPITEPMDAVVTNIEGAYIEGRLEDNSDVSNGSFKANAVLRPFLPN